MLGFSGWEPRFSSGLPAPVNLLGGRHRLAAYSNIRFLDDCQVLGLLSNASKTSVTGVRVRHYNYPQHPSATEEALQANLVVDASGRNSQAPQWLEALGYAPPQETVINSFLGCQSLVSASDWSPVWWQTLVVWPKPPDSPRAGMLYPIEGDRWILTVAGVGRDYPPTDEAFLEFTRSLRSSILYEAIKDAQPLIHLRLPTYRKSPASRTYPDGQRAL